MPYFTGKRPRLDDGTGGSSSTSIDDSQSSSTTTYSSDKINALDTINSNAIAVNSNDVGVLQTNLSNLTSSVATNVTNISSLQSSVSTNTGTLSDITTVIQVDPVNFTATVHGDLTSNSTHSARSQVSQVMTVDLEANESFGVTGFNNYPISSPFCSKRVTAFHHVFNGPNQMFKVAIPDAMFEPNIGNFRKGHAAVKVKFTSFAFTGSGVTLSGGIQYREVVSIIRQADFGTNGSIVCDNHVLHDVTTKQMGQAAQSYVTINPLHYAGPLPFTTSGNNSDVDTEVALGIEFFSWFNLPAETFVMLRGTIESV